MMAGTDLTERERARIASVLRQHTILFADGMVTSAPSVRRECAELLRSLDQLSPAQCARLTSILLQHELIFGTRGAVSTPGSVSDHLDLAEALRRERVPTAVPLEPATAPVAEAPPPALVAAAPPSTEPPPDQPEPLEPPERPEPPEPAEPAAPAPPPPPVVASPAPPPPGPPKRPPALGDRTIRLFGPERRTELPRDGGMLLFLHYDPAARVGSVLIHPVGWVWEARLESEPITVSLDGPCHGILVRSEEPPTEARIDARSGPLPLPFSEDELYVIHVVGGRRILISSRPAVLPGVVDIRGEPEAGVYSFCVPPDGRAFRRTADLVREFLAAHAGIPADTADHVAYFAAARLVGSGFARLGRA